MFLHPHQNLNQTSLGRRKKEGGKRKYLTACCLQLVLYRGGLEVARQIGWRFLGPMNLAPMIHFLDPRVKSPIAVIATHIRLHATMGCRN